MIAKKEGAITKLRKEAPEAAKCKECANASHEKEVNGERPPFTFSFSHLTSTISACRISAAGVARCFLICDASNGSFHMKLPVSVRSTSWEAYFLLSVPLPCSAVY